MGALCGFVWLGCDVLFFLYMYFRLPETRNRTTAEIEYLFKLGVPPRRFKQTKVDGESLQYLRLL